MKLLPFGFGFFYEHEFMSLVMPNPIFGLKRLLPAHDLLKSCVVDFGMKTKFVSTLCIANKITGSLIFVRATETRIVKNYGN